MSTKSPECWASDPNARGLRIEVSPERSLLLPHGQFIFAELTSGGDEQNLKLVFATHEVSIRGHHLRRIETTMQRLELSLLTKLPRSQRSLITEGQPVVLEIAVTEVDSHQNRAENTGGASRQSKSLFPSSRSGRKNQSLAGQKLHRSFTSRIGPRRRA